MIQSPRTLLQRSARLKVRIESARVAIKHVTRASLLDWGYLEPPPSGAPRLSWLPLYARVLVTAFVVTIGLGYASAIVNLHLAHGGADGKPGLSRDDVIATFHGLPSRTRLIAQVEGPMRERLKSEAEVKAIVDWALAGARQETWETVHPIFAKRCVVCHGRDGEREDVPLDTYEAVARHNRIEPIVTLRRLVTLTHIHVLAMGGMFGVLGAAFCFTSYPARLKLLAVALPFAGMALDFGGWWLARLDAHFCDLILLGGALSGLAMAVLVGGTVADAWVLPRVARWLA